MCFDDSTINSINVLKTQITLISIVLHLNPFSLSLAATLSDKTYIIMMLGSKGHL